MITKKKIREDDLFPTIIGQESVKAKLGFLIDNYNYSYFCPHLLLMGHFGSGKSTIAKEISKKLHCKNSPNKLKKQIIVHGMSLQEEADFFNLLAIPYLTSEYCTLIIEEGQDIGIKCQETLLTILEDSPNHITKYNFENNEYIIDFHKVTIITCTTDAQRLTKPLLSRFEVIQMEDIDNETATNILLQNLKGYSTNEEIVENIVNHTSQNPRELVRLATNIKTFLQRQNKNSLSQSDWCAIKNGLQLRMFGLDNIHIKLLESLKNNPSTLTKLSAALSLTPSNIRTYVEIPLLKRNLISIKLSGRMITSNGLRYLEQIRNYPKDNQVQ